MLLLCISFENKLTDIKREKEKVNYETMSLYLSSEFKQYLFYLVDIKYFASVNFLFLFPAGL